MEIKNIFENLEDKEGNYFSLPVNQDGGTPSVIAGTSKNNDGFGVAEIVAYEVVPNDEAPFDMFSIFQDMFEKAKDEITNNILGMKPNIQAVIDGGSYSLFSNKLTNLAFSNTEIASWYDAEEDYTYILTISMSEEEMQFGYLAMILLCRLENE